MSAFRNGYDGGFDFESASGNVRPTEDVEIMYDDMGGARRPMPQRRGGSSFSESIPQRARDNSPRYREYLPEDELEDDFDDYRPGERLVSDDRLTASYAELRRDRASNGGFDDDFDDDGVMFDDHNAPPRRGSKNRPQLDDFGDVYDEPRRPSQGSRLGYSRYGDDHTYSDEDYQNEFAGIRGLSTPKRAPERAPEPRRDGGRQRAEAPRGRSAQSQPHPQQRSQQRPPQRKAPMRDYDPNEGYERFDDEPNDGYNDSDGYYGRASMRDRAYEGNGVPKIFADYFHDDDDYDDYDYHYDGYCSDDYWDYYGDYYDDYWDYSWDDDSSWDNWDGWNSDEYSWDGPDDWYYDSDDYYGSDDWYYGSDGYYGSDDWDWNNWGWY